MAPVTVRCHPGRSPSWVPSPLQVKSTGRSPDLRRQGHDIHRDRPRLVCFRIGRFRLDAHLPAANSVKPGHEYLIKKTDNNSNLITVAANGSDKIDGAASYTNLAAQYKYLRINSDGVGNWLITGSN